MPFPLSLLGIHTKAAEVSMDPAASRMTYKQEALWQIIHHPEENTVCIFDRDLETRIFGYRKVLDELNLMLGNGGSSLKVYVLPERLQRFIDHPHDPFIEFIHAHSNASITAVEHGSGMPNAIWGGQQVFEALDGNFGMTHVAGDHRHRELGIMFNNLPRLYGCAVPVLDR